MFEWKMAYAAHSECTDIKCINDIENTKLKTIDATVPGNFELDLMNAGIIKPLYYSVNTLEAQKYENTDIWYYTTFMADDDNIYLHFEGIDTYSDIYVNGEKVK